jgi:hypothetical protein
MTPIVAAKNAAPHESLHWKELLDPFARRCPWINKNTATGAHIFKKSELVVRRRVIWSTLHDTDLGATVTHWFKNNMPIVWWWVALIAVSLIVFAASRGTEFAQLGIGLLSASLALLVAMAIFEVIWQLAAKSLGPSDGEDAGKSRRRGR